MPIKKVKRIIIVFILMVLIASIFLFYKFMNNKNKIIEYGELALTQFATSILTHSRQNVLYGSYVDGLIIINRKEDNSIESIDYDMIAAMRLADEIMSEAESTIHEVLNGDYIAKDDSRYELNLEEISKNKGIIGYIPFASFFDLPFLSFIDISIPIKYNNFSLVFSKIDNVVEDYGINHMKIELLLYVRLTQKMTLPFFNEQNVLEYNFSLALKIAYGDLPQYYYRIAE